MVLEQRQSTECRTIESMRPRLVGCVLVLLAVLGAATHAASEAPGQTERTAWFRQAKFGMFVHWGLYAVPAGEWKGSTNHAEWIMLTGKIPSPEYEKFAPQFNPVEFDAEQWTQLAKDAGMKYLVITSKHHDGFCMYDSAATTYDIIDATPFKRDPMKELAAACKETGVKLCFYYSVPDWHHPEFPAQYSQRGFHGDPNPNADLDKYVTYVKKQVKELLTNYGPVGIMWFDGGGSFRDVDRGKLMHADEIIDMIHRLQPKCLVNNRLGPAADYGTPEQHIPGKPPKSLFEVCMTLNGHWGYNKHDDNWKSPETVVRNLVDIVGKGGNYLLNVGPTAEGTIPDESIRILRQVGRWMDANGESIYGTTASPFRRLPWGRCTVKPGKLYLHVFNWPTDGRLVVPRLRNQVGKAYLLTDQQNTCAVQPGDEQVTIRVPKQMPDPIDTVVVLEIAGDPDIAPIYIQPNADGSVELKAGEAIVEGDTARYESGGGKDNIGAWTDPEDYVSWTFAIRQPGTYRVEITYSCTSGAAGGEFAVTTAGQTVVGKTRTTGQWTDFVTDELGTLDIAEAGKYTLTVKSKTMPGYAVMNLKAVTLNPQAR